MKKNGRNTHRSETKASLGTSGSGRESDFYEQPNREAPLNEYSGGAASHNRRTSKNAVARRRENNTRASDVQLVLLMLKILMVPVLLAAAYLGLKFAVTHFEEKQIEKDGIEWEKKAVLMDQGAVVEKIAADLGDEVSMERFLERAKREQVTLESVAALKQRGMDEEAVDELKRVLEFMPTSFKVQMELLDLYMRMGRYDEAIPLSAGLLLQDSSDREIKKSLLVALHEIGRPEACLVLAKQMLEDEPGTIQVMEVAAYAYAVLGRSDEALDLYKQILKREPERLLALEAVGVLYEWREEWAKALPYYMELVTLDPQPRRYRVLALNLARQNEAGKTALIVGQAFGLYGAGTVSPWLSEAGFDSVRETMEFRAITDQIVGAKIRQEIERIRQREEEKDETRERAADGLLLPSQHDLNILKPSINR